MTIDRYTKAVLTVIAGCLLWQCVMTGGRAVEAQQIAPGLAPGQAQPVVIVGWGEMTSNGRVTLTLKRGPDGTMVTEPTLPVRLPYSDRNPMPVHVDSAQQPIPVAVNGPVRLDYSQVNPLPVGVTRVKRGADDDWDPIKTEAVPDVRQKYPGAFPE